MPIIYDPRPIATDFEGMITPIRILTLLILVAWAIMQSMRPPVWVDLWIVTATLYNVATGLMTRKRHVPILDLVSPMVHGSLSVVALYFTGGVESPFTWVLTLTVASYALRMPSLKALIMGGVLVAAGLAINPLTGNAADPIRYVGFAFSNMAVIGLVSSVVAVNSRHRSQLLSTIAHELRTPMTVLKGNIHLARILLAKGKPAEDAVARLALADKELENLTALLDKLQETLIHSEELDNAKVPLEIASEVEERLSAYRVEEGRTIAWKPEGAPLWVLASRHQFRLIVDDLLSNAIKFSPPEAGISVGLWREGGKAHFTVTDSGRGIPKDELDRVFDGFYRVNPRSTKDPGGMGLGLYSARKLVSQHGGDIWIESTEGQGTTVHVLLPLISA